MATYYVDYDGGLDTNDGLSTSTAWKTLAHANASMANGDKLYIKASATGYTYATEGNADPVFEILSLSEYEGYTTTPGDGGTVTIDGESLAAHCIYALDIYQATLKNIRCTGATGDGVLITSDVSATAGHAFAFYDCEFDNNGGAGINQTVGPDSRYVDCSAHDNTGAGFQIDIDVGAYDNATTGQLMLRCKAQNNGTYGITSYGGLCVIDSYANGNGSTGIVAPFAIRCIATSNGNGIQVTRFASDCIAYSNTGFGIKVGDASPSEEYAYRCASVSNGTGIEGIGSPTVDWNLVYGNATQYSGVSQGSNDLTTVDPEYAAPNLAPTNVDAYSLGEETLIDGSTVIGISAGSGIPDNAIGGAGVEVDCETLLSGTRATRFRTGETLTVGGSGVKVKHIALDSVAVEVTVRKVSDDSLIATLLDTTYDFSTPDVYVSWATLNGGSAPSWSVSSEAEFYVRVHVTHSAFGSTIASTQQFIAANDNAVTIDVETQLSGSREETFTTAQTVTVDGPGITVWLAASAVSVTVEVRKQSDDSLVSTLLSTTADFTAGQTRTLADIAGSAVQWTSPSSGSYYVRTTVSHSSLALDPTVAEQQFAVRTSTATSITVGEHTVPGTLIWEPTDLNAASPYGGTVLGYCLRGYDVVPHMSLELLQSGEDGGVDPFEIAYMGAIYELRCELVEWSAAALARAFLPGLIDGTKIQHPGTLDWGAGLYQHAGVLLFEPVDTSKEYWLARKAIGVLVEGAEIHHGVLEPRALDLRFLWLPDPTYGTSAEATVVSGTFSELSL